MYEQEVGPLDVHGVRNGIALPEDEVDADHEAVLTCPGGFVPVEDD